MGANRGSNVSKKRKRSASTSGKMRRVVRKKNRPTYYKVFVPKSLIEPEEKTECIFSNTNADLYFDPLKCAFPTKYYADESPIPCSPTNHIPEQLTIKWQTISKDETFEIDDDTRNFKANYPGNRIAGGPLRWIRMKEIGVIHLDPNDFAK